MGLHPCFERKANHSMHENTKVRLNRSACVLNNFRGRWNIIIFYASNGRCKGRACHAYIVTYYIPLRVPSIYYIFILYVMRYWLLAHSVYIYLCTIYIYEHVLYAHGLYSWYIPTPLSAPKSFRLLLQRRSRSHTHSIYLSHSVCPSSR